MKKRNLIIGSLLAGSIATIGAVSVAQACNDPGGHSRGGFSGHHRGEPMMHVMKNLDLSTEQRQAIRKIRNETRDKMDAKRDEMYEIRQALQKLASAETYDENKVRELANSRSQIMTEMTVQRFATMSRIRKELTTEQLEKMDTYKDRRFKRDDF